MVVWRLPLYCIKGFVGSWPIFSSVASVCVIFTRHSLDLGAISHSQDRYLINRKGVVRTVSGNHCTVELYDKNRVVSVSCNNVDPVEVSKNDKVRTLHIL